MLTGTESRKDETEVNESATTSINEDIDKGKTLIKNRGDPSQLWILTSN